MRTIAPICLLVTLSAAALGAGKPLTHTAPPPPDPEVLRQGGDTIETAIPITYWDGPYHGTTTGYTDDYDEVCPYTGSTSPDVVYSVTTEGSSYDIWSFDTYGSSYDTKIYVYDSAGQLVGCNDDFYPDYTSLLDVCLLHNDTYYLVIDGWGGDHGDYVLNVSIFCPAIVDCADHLWPEGEILQDEVLDTFNCGCDCADQVVRLLDLPTTANGTVEMCGGLGWTTVAGELHHDTDWLSFRVGPTGTVHGEIISTNGMDMPVFLAGGCDGLPLLQVVELWPATPVEFDIAAAPGQEIWIVPHTILADPPCGGSTPQQYDYELYLSGLELPVAVETMSWTAVKRRYR